MSSPLELPRRAACAIWRWPWGRFLGILAVFSLLGPLLGTLALCLGNYAWRGGSFPATPLLGDLFYGFMIGFIIGFPFAFVTGAIFATSALKFGKSKARHALGAALLAFLLIVGSYLFFEHFIAHRPALAMLGLGGGADLLGIFLAPSLVAALICHRLTRRWNGATG